MRVRLTFLAIILALMAPGFAHALPILVCNPEGVTLTTGQTITYNLSGLPGTFASTNIPSCSDANFGFCVDLASLPPGSYTITGEACLNDPMQGQACTGPSSPFTFSRIGPPPVPTGMGLSSKQ